MNGRLCGLLCAAVMAAWLLFSIFPLSAQTPTESSRPTSDVTPKKADKPDEKEARVSIAVARERSAMLHMVYAATLDTIHHHYFRKNEAVLPARAMEDVFSTVARKSHAKARWISVNTKPMSVDHEPEGAFEKKAAAEIAAGHATFETVEDGYFRSATAIPLGGGCLSCHANSSFGPPPKGPRFAGLVISIPVKED